MPTGEHAIYCSCWRLFGVLHNFCPANEFMLLMDEQRNASWEIYTHLPRAYVIRGWTIGLRGEEWRASHHNTLPLAIFLTIKILLDLLLAPRHASQ
jgi:hypothetical protein